MMVCQRKLFYCLLFLFLSLRHVTQIWLRVVSHLVLWLSLSFLKSHRCELVNPMKKFDLDVVKPLVSNVDISE